METLQFIKNCQNGHWMSRNDVVLVLDMNMMRKLGQLRVMGCAIPPTTELGLGGIHPLMAIVYDDNFRSATFKRFN